MVGPLAVRQFDVLAFLPEELLNKLNPIGVLFELQPNVDPLEGRGRCDVVDISKLIAAGIGSHLKRNITAAPGHGKSQHQCEQPFHGPSSDRQAELRRQPPA